MEGGAGEGEICFSEPLLGSRLEAGDHVPGLADKEDGVLPMHCNVTIHICYSMACCIQAQACFIFLQVAHLPGCYPCQSVLWCLC